MTQPRAILFDLDDTIISLGERAASILRAAEEFSTELAPFSSSYVADQLENDFTLHWSDPARQKLARLSMENTRRSLVAHSLARLSEGMFGTELANRFANRFAALREESLELFPSAQETLIALRSRGVALALVTNGSSDVQRAKIERYSLTPLFDHIQIEGESGFGKPDEKAYRHAMGALGVVAGETWMVGDNLEWEVAVPQQFGILGIWHDHKGRGLPAGTHVRPDRVITRLGELLE
ncbi:MAG: HAD family hydrolase [Pseudomonadota bacterium]